MRRRAILAAALALGCRRGRNGTGQPLRIGSTVNPLNLPIWLAVERGRLAEAGFDVQMHHIAGSASREFPLKLARGELDLAQGSPTAALFQQLIEGFDIRVPASLGLEKAGRMPSGQLAVLKERAKEIKTLSDLRGRTVEGLSPGPSGFLATQAIRKAGLEPGRDVTLTFRGRSPQDIFALVENKGADVLSMQADFATMLERRGKVVRWLSMSEVVPWYQPSLLTASARFASDSAALGRFLEVFLLSCRELNALEGRWTPELTALVGKWTKAEDVSAITDQGGVPYYDPNGAVSLDSLSRVQDFWVETKQVASKIDVGRLVDTAGLKLALGSVGVA